MSSRADRTAAEPTRRDRSGRWLVPGVGGLLVIDLAGGLLSIANGLNTPVDAWGSNATLAAPIPMMAAQAFLAVAAARWNDSRGAVAAGLLAVACGISGVSGFFDGQFGKPGMPAALVAFQSLLVVATLAVGGLAATRLVRLVRSSRRH
jgi:hypothetical protein